tara:strand:+ start:55730 stop:57547 length:1818 start_codon:yes stop_codon:yes gene_type:complete
MAKKINYTARNFADVRLELINFAKQYYPDIFNDFNDASVGMMLIELNAATGDMLSHHTDRMFQETQIDFAQERNSILSMARTFGLKVPGKRPSITIADFSVTVPVLGDTYDISYAPIIKRGVQISGAGKVFESTNEIDFSSPFTIGGIPNLLIIPNFDSNNTIISYTLTKREIVINGVSKILQRVLTEENVIPFFEIVLPDDNVISINSIITLEGTNFNSVPTTNQFYDDDLRWFEVDALADDVVFIVDDSVSTDDSAIKPGKFKRVNQRFIKEYTDNGFCKIIFGGGTEDISSLCEFGVDETLVNRLGNFINNTSLGSTVSANQTMFINYRIGGGSDTNIGPNVLKTINKSDLTVTGSDNVLNQQVVNSLTVNNPLPALGGKDELSIEEIRNLVKYNFSAQNRAVTIEDYKSRIALMPGEFGVPFRNNVLENQNKIMIYILTLESDGTLKASSNTTLKQNIATYLADYRMINDYVEVTNGMIYNLGFEVDLFVDKQFSQSQVISETISEVTAYFDINKWGMGDNIYVAPLVEIINNVPGVLNVVDLRVYNKVGQGRYSSNEIPQPYIDDETRQIDLLNDYTIYGDPSGMFEIKRPDIDIKVRVK